MLRKLEISDLLTYFAIIYWIFILIYAYFQMITRPQFAVLFLGGSIVIYTFDELIDSGWKKISLDNSFLWASSAITLIITIYLYLNFEVLLLTRVGYAHTYEYILAISFILAVFYLSYRSFGLGFISVVAGALIYGYFGPYFPGLLRHSGISELRLIRLLVLEFEGFYGSITELVAAWVSLFLLYAGLLKGYGAFDLIIRSAMKVADYIKSGVAQSAVIASMVIGSINGAQTANAAMTGSFTIPLMKESGIKADVAGAIEAVASSGGQIMPPVMGAAAFVMASLLGITYINVLVAGLIPAAIFFLSVAIAVHYAAIRSTDGSTVEVDFEEKIDTERTREELLVDSVKFIIPFVVLIYTLGVLQWTVMTSALFTCVLMIICGVAIPIMYSIIKTEYNIKDAAISTLEDTVEGFRYGATMIAPIAIIIAVINGVVDILAATGMPSRFSLAMLEISGGILAIAVILAMIICILLGLGMPTVAAYTIVAILVAPTFVNDFLLPDLAAHYFVFYSAILSGITPPIAVSVVVTTGIAGSNFWRTCYEAIKIAITLFILPISFIYNPEIVVGGLTGASIASGAIVLLGAVSVTHGINYHKSIFGSRRFLNKGMRGLYLILGLIAMVYPSTEIRIGSVLMIFTLLGLQHISTSHESYRTKLT